MCRDRLERLGRQVGLTNIVLTPFVGAHNSVRISHHGWPVEALSERVFDQGSRCGMMSVDPTMDITQQMLPLFDGDAALQDPGVASLVEFDLHKNNRTWRNIRAIEPPSCPSVVRHREGS